MKKLQITNRIILATAEKMGWSNRIVSESAGLIAVTPPGKQELILKSGADPFATIPQYYMSVNKYTFYELAQKQGIPVPQSLLYEAGATDIEQIVADWQSIVVKPIDGTQGYGITVGCTTVAAVRSAIEHAQKVSDDVIIQKQFYGNDYRVLVIGDRVAAVTHRRPAFVIGNGRDNLAQLIDLENASDRRIDDYSEKLCTIDREKALTYLGNRATKIPSAGEEVIVYNVPNIGQGGQAVNVTDQIGKLASALAVKAAAMVGLRCAGVDLLCQDITSDNLNDFAIIEINTMPSFVVHEFPHVGNPINVSKLFLREIAK